MALGRGLQSLIPPKGNGSEPAEIVSRDEPRFSRGAAPEEPSAPQENNSKYEARGGERDRSEAIFHIEIEKIKTNPYQPRREFSDIELRELAHSIQEFGIIQPIIVSKVVRETSGGTDVEYQLVAGERRLRAAKIAGLERIPAIIKKVSSGKMGLELALIENIQRKDLNALEAAKAYARLQDEFGLTQREIASRVGKNREAIANALRLLNLPSEIQSALMDGRISESHARALLSLSDIEAQRQAFLKIINEKSSVKALKENSSFSASPESGEQRFWEKKLEDKFQTSVKIISGGGKGKVLLPFYSNEEMRALIDKLLGSDAA